ncbi:uncharacterized protein GBIM_09578, partial [Gryllus bimaculatus]
PAPKAAAPSAPSEAASRSLSEIAEESDALTSSLEEEEGGSELEEEEEEEEEAAAEEEEPVAAAAAAAAAPAKAEPPVVELWRLKETDEERRAREASEERERQEEEEERRKRMLRVSRLTKTRAQLNADQKRLQTFMSRELDQQLVDLEVHPASTCPRDRGYFQWPTPPNNPYYKFLRKSPAKAAVWRRADRPHTTGQAMDTAVLLHPEYNLLEKANHITHTITTEFLEWMESLGGVQQTELKEDILQQLFDVTFDLPAAHALCVRVRELPVVTKAIADAAFAPQ